MMILMRNLRCCCWMSRRRLMMASMMTIPQMNIPSRRRRLWHWQKKIDDGFYDDDPADEYTEQEEKIVALAKEIDNQIVVDNINARLDTGSGVQTINRASRSRTQDRTASGFRANMESFGVDMQDTASSKFVRSKKRERSESVAAKAGKRDGSRAPSKMMRMESVAAKRARSKSVPRDEIG